MQLPRAAYSRSFNLDLVEILGGVVPNWKAAKVPYILKFSWFENFVKTLKLTRMLIFVIKNFVIALGEITARLHVL